MENQSMKDLLLDNPIIAAVSSHEKLMEAVDQSHCDVLFILYGDIMTLKQEVDFAKNKGKTVFVHMDLILGLSHDSHSLEYIHEVIQPAGILTTKASLVKKAKDLDMYVVQRLFMLDSKSFKDGIDLLKRTKPDAVEIMPGVVTKAITAIAKNTRLPVIAGGLIDTKQEIMDALDAGATSVSTSDMKLWSS